MARPTGGKLEYIAWTAAITAVATVIVERIVNHTAETGQRITNPVKDIAPRGGMNGPRR